MFSGALAEQLRRRGHDVVSIQDASYSRLQGASDRDVFEAALEEGRTVVSEDVSGFRGLELEAVAEGRAVPRFIFTTDRQFPRGDPATLGRLVRALDALLTGEAEVPAVVFLRRRE